MSGWPLLANGHRVTGLKSIRNLLRGTPVYYQDVSAPLSRSSSRALVTVLALAAVTNFREPKGLCTPIGVPIGRSSDDVFFIGTALPDTVLAGAGNQEWGTGRGHSGVGRPREIYGQLVQIEQLRGLSATRLPVETKTLVLVPWDYGADCSTVVWGKSARWAAPQARFIFSARLRTREQWVDDLPTLDVSTPEFSLYPFDTRRFYMLRDTAMNDLPLEDVLDLYERLPLDRDLSDSPDSAIRPLESWARSNPTLARRQPARTILEFVRFDAEERHASLIKSPIVGTYRFVFRVPPVDSLVMYARTDARPWGTERARYEVGMLEDSASDGGVIGYSLLTAWAISPQALPRDTKKASAQVAISMIPVLETSDSSVWHGNEEALDRELNPEFWNRVIYRRYPNIRSMRNKDWYYMPGFWTIYRDGAVRFRHTVEQNGVIIFSIVGERISSETMTRSKDQH